MGKYITDERTGLKYELVGDYYLIAGDDEPEERPTCTLLWKYSVSACGMRLRQPQRIFRNGGKENFGY